MNEKIEMLKEVVEIVDGIKYTNLTDIGNYIARNDLVIEGKSYKLPHYVESESVWHNVNLWVPLVAEGSQNEVPLKFIVRSGSMEYITNIFLFQDLASTKNTIRYYVGDRFDYNSAIEAQGNNRDGGNRILKCVCEDLKEVNMKTVKMILY
ncbi:hypothetical protein B5C26_11875 [Photorhabdus luminescens]|uniref:hypothetical protein n=1 Tax=Photorhabdus luminescens TaxID=29488 RepID=UPI000B4C36CA|nr:hypothetical protein [Photorhabdus luminescens]OWO82280.1 hypothetical protein B5C26_11875 [Photorhabdus luminescens]